MNKAKSHEPELPPVGSDGLRRWQVAGGVVVDHRGWLLVENKRRNGDRDWSTAGGVVDPGETMLTALTREVKEETGITVDSWIGPIYRVEVKAPEAGFFLEVEAYRSEEFHGEINIDDPDGIVIAAEFVDTDRARSLLDGTPTPWVSEPLLAHIERGVADGRTYRYLVEGKRGEKRTITTDHDRAGPPDRT